MQLADSVASILRPGSEEDFCVSVVIKVGYDGFTGKANAAARHLEWPVAMLGFVEPIRVNAAIVGGKEDLFSAVAIQVCRNSVGDAVLNDSVILGERPAAGCGRGNDSPVETT